MWLFRYMDFHETFSTSNLVNHTLVCLSESTVNKWDVQMDQSSTEYFQVFFGSEECYKWMRISPLSAMV